MYEDPTNSTIEKLSNLSHLLHNFESFCIKIIIQEYLLYGVEQEK